MDTPEIAEWPASAESWARARRSLGGGVSSGLRASMPPHPLFFERGTGSRLWDVDGNSYLDYVLGWGPVILGHSHPSIVHAVSSQLTRGQTFGAGHRAEYEVSERVCEIMPGVERVLWSNTGSEANQIALRIARAATGRTRFAKFYGHYHGWTDPMLLGYRPDSSGSLSGLGSQGQHPRGLEDTVMLPWNDLDGVATALAEHGSSIAAMFAEPVLCNSGVLAPAAGFLKGLRELCDRYGIVLVFDEVITGFRVARGGGSERFGTTADLVILAKAIAGGFSLAAVGGRGDLIDLTTTGVVHAGTYNGNPIVLAAAAATLDELGGPQVYSDFEERALQLETGLRAALTNHQVTADVHHVGPVLQMTPGADNVSTFPEFITGDWRWYDALIVEMLREGLFCLPGGRWYLSTAHTAQDVDDTVHAFDRALTRTVASTGHPAG